MIEPAVRSILLADAAVVLAVSDRVWFGLRPEGERRPGIVITRESGSDPGNLDGSAGFVNGTLQLDCLAPTYKEAKQLGSKVIDAVDYFSGDVNELHIDWLIIDDESDIAVLPPTGKASPSTFGVSLTLTFMFQK